MTEDGKHYQSRHVGFFPPDRPCLRFHSNSVTVRGILFAIAVVGIPGRTGIAKTVRIHRNKVATPMTSRDFTTRQPFSTPSWPDSNQSRNTIRGDCVFVESL